MGQKLNNHFVPQFLFRRLTEGKRYIHLVSRDGARVVHYASIRGQCARHKFYGSEIIEDWISRLEGHHSAAFCHVHDFAWDSKGYLLSARDHYHLREAVMLQHARTPRKAHMLSTATDQMILYSYRKYLTALPQTPERKAQINAIDNGTATIADSKFYHLMMSLNAATRAVTAISDLTLLILRNQTSYPFILGDAPAVFNNHYMREIRNSGVLGYLTPGLMITMPMDTKTQLLFYDDSVYTPDYRAAGCIDLINQSDVSQLNAMQIHASQKNIYFADIASEDYIRELLAAHASLLQNPSSRLIVHRDGECFFDGVSIPGEVLHVFEPQLPITLDLRFFTTVLLPDNENPNRPRNPTLANEVNLILRVPEHPSSLSMPKFAQWIQSQMRYPEST